jgi:hypothetical protein
LLSGQLGNKDVQELEQHVVGQPSPLHALDTISGLKPTYENYTISNCRLGYKTLKKHKPATVSTTGYRQIL